jgi:hypothetical protein
MGRNRSRQWSRTGKREAKSDHSGQGSTEATERNRERRDDTDNRASDGPTGDAVARSETDADVQRTPIAGRSTGGARAQGDQQLRHVRSRPGPGNGIEPLWPGGGGRPGDETTAPRRRVRERPRKAVVRRGNACRGDGQAPRHAGVPRTAGRRGVEGVGRRRERGRGRRHRIP